jgi:hypothetical protein
MRRIEAVVVLAVVCLLSQACFLGYEAKKPNPKGSGMLEARNVLERKYREPIKQAAAGFQAFGRNPEFALTIPWYDAQARDGRNAPSAGQAGSQNPLSARDRQYYESLRKRFENTKHLADPPVDETLNALKSGEKIVIEFPCPDGSTARIEITVEYAAWDPAAKEKIGFCDWSGETSLEQQGDAKIKVTKLKAVIMFDVPAMKEKDKSVRGQVENVGTFYHELLHVQLLLDAMRGGAGGDWKDKFCKCDFDWGPADLDDPHRSVNGFEESYREKLWKWIGDNPIDNPWNERPPEKKPEGKIVPTPDPKPVTPLPKEERKPEPGKRPGIKSFERGTTKVEVDGKWVSGWNHRVTVETGETEVHDIHVVLTNKGAKAIEAFGPKGWGRGKISEDGKTITFEKGPKGIPITPGGEGTFSFKTLQKEVTIHWYLTDQDKNRIEDASGTQTVALFPRDGQTPIDVASVIPGSASSESVITIWGRGFGTSANKLRLIVGGADATILQANEIEILAVVPENARGTGLKVHRGRDQSNLFPFRVGPSLKTSLIGPLNIVPGENAEVTVDIVGTDEPQRIQVISPDPETATISGAVLEERKAELQTPSVFTLRGLRSGNIAPVVRLLTPDRKPSVLWDAVAEPSLEKSLADPDTPAILDIDPQSSSPGQPVVIYGRHFGTDAGAISIKLGNKELKVIETIPQRIVAMLPSDANSGKLQVYRNGRPALKPAWLDIKPSLQLTASHEIVPKGKRIRIQVNLLGSDQPRDVDLYCKTPSIAIFEQSKIHQRVRTSGGLPNTASLLLDTLRAGQFQVEGIIRDREPETSQWLEVHPAKLTLQAGQTKAITVYLVRETDGEAHREEIEPEEILLDAAAGHAGWRGDITAGSPGAYLVVIQAAGMQTSLEMVVK